MRALLLTLIALLALSACRGQKRACEDAFRELISGPSVPGPRILVLARHCIDDRWNEDALDCVAAARDVPALEACTVKLSSDQRSALER